LRSAPIHHGGPGERPVEQRARLDHGRGDLSASAGLAATWLMLVAVLGIPQGSVDRHARRY
jgi:hypothetical protein